LTWLLVSFNSALELKILGGQHSMYWQNNVGGFHCNKK